MNGHMTLGVIRPKKQMAFSKEEAACSRQRTSLVRQRTLLVRTGFFAFAPIHG
jgi:hypothetical protein